MAKLRATGRKLVGYDQEAGMIVRKSLYEDEDGEQYVRLGRYATSTPDTHVTREWFCEHVLGEGMIER